MLTKAKTLRGQGYGAQKQGESLLDNPYIGKNKRSTTLWAEGWKESADFTREMNNFMGFLQPVTLLSSWFPGLTPTLVSSKAMIQWRAKTTTNTEE